MPVVLILIIPFFSFSIFLFVHHITICYIHYVTIYVASHHMTALTCLEDILVLSKAGSDSPEPLYAISSTAKLNDLFPWLGLPEKEVKGDPWSVLLCSADFEASHVLRHALSFSFQGAATLESF